MKTFLIRRRHFDLSATRMGELGGMAVPIESVTVDGAKNDDARRHGGLVGKA